MATPRGQAKTSPVCNPKPKSSDTEWENALKEARESVAKATAAASADSMSSAEGNAATSAAKKSSTGVTVDFFQVCSTEPLRDTAQHVTLSISSSEILWWSLSLVSQRFH